MEQEISLDQEEYFGIMLGLPGLFLADPDLSLRQNKVLDYADRLVKKQMRAVWLFREAAAKHGGILCEGGPGDGCGHEILRHQLLLSGLKLLTEILAWQKENTYFTEINNVHTVRFLTCLTKGNYVKSSSVVPPSLGTLLLSNSRK
ncbi:tetratricopeptide repeat protein 1 [Striga asiatica]|uniref:Tetratricopeptide repeat protein 1 n=1 Tax=Striga asiatica TaxID=4170 RepID=A0A5A7PFH8_STRAF|nr:tetratricopeptide repeat protein 1 [Striga asiatica]